MHRATIPSKFNLRQTPSMLSVCGMLLIGGCTSAPSVDHSTPAQPATHTEAPPPRPTGGIYISLQNTIPPTAGTEKESVSTTEPLIFRIETVDANSVAPLIPFIALTPGEHRLWIVARTPRGQSEEPYQAVSVNFIAKEHATYQIVPAIPARTGSKYPIAYSAYIMDSQRGGSKQTAPCRPSTQEICLIHVSPDFKKSSWQPQPLKSPR